MNTQQIVEQWFEIWEKGNFEQLPISEAFIHQSPYGIISGKEAYLNLVRENREQFLNHVFNIQDVIVNEAVAAVRYVAIQGDFELEVSEWHFVQDGLIYKVVAYYNIEETRIEID